MANQVSCVPSTQTLKPTITTIARRSANYEESFADYDFIQSLKCDYTGEMYERRLEKLKEEVRLLLEKVDQSVVDRLKLIDTLQRLGVGYHFKKEIKEALRIISTDDSNTRLKDDLYATALRFRLLRQHGFEVSQDVLNGFKGDKGDFMASLCEDTKGMLSLYEASHLAYEGEILLDEAKAFTTVHLHDALKGKRIEQKLARQVHHALKLPLHWRLPKLESRWYIEEIYVEEEDSNPLLFELAKLDYNMVQGIYQTNVKATSRWWKNLGLGKQLSFARDRLIECFLWALGPLSEPEFGLSREVVTKAFQLITSIDDIYDLHGSLEELELFTDVVERWDVNVMEQLPHYMKLCFLALFNTINEIAYDTLKEQGWEITQYLKKLAEIERGDVPKSIQCYMHETGASEAVARQHILGIISDTWKKMNKDSISSSLFPEPFIKIVVDAGRICHHYYHESDGFGAPNSQTKEQIILLLVEPILVKK
ncbi:alpha-terpineol synthase, chloroplastic-like isoform X2 [Tasmannia lanceolata]|uniref:alpha-terpineol synthase, chloroplastic-like isoform X2 n=1 Tax=Tasmannia lanceolata TaxID=3420 RepID=UPI0040631608